MKKFIAAIFILASGCVPLIIGSGIVTGYVLGTDSASGNVNTEYRALWDLCIEKLEAAEAEALEANESKGVIKGKVSGNNIAIKINSISSSTQRLRISARRFLLPKPQAAQRLFFTIVDELE